MGKERNEEKVRKGRGGKERTGSRVKEMEGEEGKTKERKL